MSQQVRVELGSRAYEVRVGDGLLAATNLSTLVPGRHVLIVTDENVAPLYLPRVLSSLGDKTRQILVLPPGEQ